MDQQIRYCRTSDGVDIAFSTHGSGVPVVIAPNLVNSHLQAELLPGSRVRGFYERLAERLLVVRYDRRGTGMSQRDALDLSPEAGERDLLAVVDRLGLDRFALYDHVLAGRAPAMFAARHPDRVSCLVRWVGQTVTNSPEIMRRIAAIDGLMDTDWNLYCDINARLICGWDAPDAASLAEQMRAGATPQTRRAAIEELFATRDDASAAWADITVPTLIAHCGGAERSAARARDLAIRVPNAHLIAVPGHPRATAPIGDDNAVLIAAIADFVEAAATAHAHPPPVPELQLAAMRAILWTDVVGHTLLVDRYGDARARELLRQHDDIIRAGLARHGGTEVKAMGDGFMAWFSSAHRALDCAVALQRAFAGRNATAEEPLELRVGLNAGEPIVEDDDLFGASVIAAARICAEAGTGEIVVSDVVRQLVAGKGFEFDDCGAVELKGFEQPVRLARVHWEPDTGTPRRVG